MSAKRRLFIAAEPRLASSLAEQFATSAGVELAESETPWPDAIFLDDRTCAAAHRIDDLRRRGFAGAIILVASDVADHPGADAILTRPFRFAALDAAIERALARRIARRLPASYGDGARFTEKEAAILARLARAEGMAVSKTELLAEVWGYGPNVSTRTLETHIHRLRRKIEPDPSRPSKILTTPDGYRLASEALESPRFPSPEKTV